MPIEVSFTLSEKDLDYFRDLMGRAQTMAAKVSDEDIVREAGNLLEHANEEGTAQFVRQRLLRLRRLIDMINDPEWPLAEQERLDMLSALAYFYHVEDPIDDSIPVLGLIDDAIMIELVVRELRHEIEAYEDFCELRSTETQLRNRPASRQQWLQAKQEELLERMRSKVSRKYRSNTSAGRLTRFSFLS